MIRSVLTASRTLLTLLFATTLPLTMLSGCGGGGGGGNPIPNADPTGYYENNGNATLDGGQLVVIDLQGIIHNNRLIMLSAAQGLSYDGTIVVTGNDYSGTLSVYDDGTLLGTAPVSGTITQGATVTGVLAGSGTALSGTFTLNYAANNNEAAALSTLRRSGGWSALVGGSTLELNFLVDTNGNVVDDARPSDGFFDSCSIFGPVTPVNGTHLYTVTVTLSNCLTNPAADGTYTGLAATRTQNPSTPNDRLFFAVTNGTFSLSNEFHW